jgi:hypothetical protein
MAKQGAKKRAATVTRKTGETSVNVTVSLDGSGKFDIDTGSNMFDHMLTHIAQHGLFDIKIKASGWDQHHVVEDVAIALGQALNKALGDKKGIAAWATRGADGRGTRHGGGGHLRAWLCRAGSAVQAQEDRRPGERPSAPFPQDPGHRGQG